MHIVEMKVFRKRHVLGSYDIFIILGREKAQFLRHNPSSVFSAPPRLEVSTRRQICPSLFANSPAHFFLFFPRDYLHNPAVKTAPGYQSATALQFFGAR
jgi:hypothetical protein